MKPSLYPGIFKNRITEGFLQTRGEHGQEPGL